MGVLAARGNLAAMVPPVQAQVKDAIRAAGVDEDSFGGQVTGDDVLRLILRVAVPRVSVHAASLGPHYA